MNASVSGKIEIMDTTLRDGEQTPGVNFTPKEKLEIAQILLNDLNVDRIEVASARVSGGEKEAVSGICAYAKSKECLDRVEVLGFVDRTASVDWINEAGGKVINLLTKGSLNQLKGQLGKEPEEHFRDIKETVDYAVSKGLKVNIYLEDWSYGMINSRDYVYYIIEKVSKLSGVMRIMLCDTLGVFNSDSVKESISDIVKRFPSVHFDFHAHNDYGLAVSNTLSAIGSGVSGIHTTINGLGERAGNAPLDEIVVSVNDMMPGYYVSVKESALINAGRLVSALSGKKLASNKPVSGEDVFTQTAGVHADGDKKGMLYVSKLKAERFGRKRTYALGKLSGMASIEMNLKELGISLSEDDRKRVYKRIVELGARKKQITTNDLPYIIADVLGTPVHSDAKITGCEISVTMDFEQKAKFRLLYKGLEIEAKGKGNGGYDAFWNALKSIAPRIGIELPELVDYEVRIPPGGKTDALVETTIVWQSKGKRFKTIGVNADQTLAAIEATEKMLNLI